jgi:hypothetical protein
MGGGEDKKPEQSKEGRDLGPPRALKRERQQKGGKNGTLPCLISLRNTANETVDRRRLLVLGSGTCVALLWCLLPLSVSFFSLSSPCPSCPLLPFPHTPHAQSHPPPSIVLPTSYMSNDYGVFSHPNGIISMALVALYLKVLISPCLSMFLQKSFPSSPWPLILIEPTSLSH